MPDSSLQLVLPRQVDFPVAVAPLRRRSHPAVQFLAEHHHAELNPVRRRLLGQLEDRGPLEALTEENLTVALHGWHRDDALGRLIVHEGPREPEEAVLSDEGRLERTAEVEAHQVDVGRAELVGFVAVELLLRQDRINSLEVCQARRVLDEGLERKRDPRGVGLRQETSGVEVGLAELLDFLGVKDLLLASVLESDVRALDVEERLKLGLRGLGGYLPGPLVKVVFLHGKAGRGQFGEGLPAEDNLFGGGVPLDELNIFVKKADANVFCDVFSYRCPKFQCDANVWNWRA